MHFTHACMPVPVADGGMLVMARRRSVQDHHRLLALVRDGVGDRADEELLERAALVLHQHLHARGGPVSAPCCATLACIGSGAQHCKEQCKTACISETQTVPERARTTASALSESARLQMMSPMDSLSVRPLAISICAARPRSRAGGPAARWQKCCSAAASPCQPPLTPRAQPVTGTPRTERARWPASGPSSSLVA